MLHLKLNIYFILLKSQYLPEHIILYNVAVFNPTRTSNVQCLQYLTTSRCVYIICHFRTPICNMLGYWRHRLVGYTSLFTTPLVITTISVYNELWPSDVMSWSGPLISSVIRSVISLQCFYLGVSSISVSISVSVAPQIECLRLG
jgi:hypothetical protein